MKCFFPVVLVLAVGCGENVPPPGAPLGAPSPVQGRITLADGSALRGGVIEFHPVENEVRGKLRFDGGGLVDANGHYVAGRNGDGKGLVPGEYLITVQPREVGELTGSNSRSIPQKYRERSTASRISVEERDNTIDLQLK